MNKTKFMEVLFSAVENGDEELTEQVAGDVEQAKQNGEVDTDEVTYINLGEGKVMAIDNVNQEATVIEGEGDEYEMEAMPDEEIEKYIHTLDGNTPDEGMHDGDIETVEEHEPMGTADNVENVNPEDMCSQSLNRNAAGASDYQEECPECEEREFSVSTRNTAVLRFFSDQMFYEKLMSEVIDSEDTAKVGNIQIDKVGDDEVVVTDTATGDAAKVQIDGDELEVEELDEKNFKEFSALTEDDDYSEGVEDMEQHEPMFVVGIAPDSHVVVDAPVYDEEDAQQLAEHLSEMGVEGAQLFENPDEAREYAHNLLGEEGAVDAEEPVQAEFSDRELYVTRYYSINEVEEYRMYSEGEYTSFMERLYAEAAEGSNDTQDAIEDAIESGEQVEDEEHIITPVNSTTAVVEDKENGEFTKATIDGEGVDVEKISEEEASDLTDNLDIEGKENEKEFSDYEPEYMTKFMHRLYSEEDEDLPVAQSKIEDAIENGDQIEDEDVIITPVDSETAIVEDKNNDELTKVTIDEDGMDTKAISEDEADKYFKNIDVDEDSANDEDEEKEFSETEEEIAEREYSEYLEEYTNMSTAERFFADAADQMVTIQVPASSLQTAAPADGGQASLVAPSQQGEDQVPQSGVQDAAGMGDQAAADPVELIEDKAVAAVNSIQEAAQQAAEMIQEAKEAPAPGADQDIQEAQFSDYYDDDERSFADTDDLENNPMLGWLNSTMR